MSDNIIKKLIESYSEEDQIKILKKAGYKIDLNYKCWEQDKDDYNRVEYIDRFVKVAYLGSISEKNIKYLYNYSISSVFREYIEDRLVEIIKTDLSI